MSIPFDPADTSGLSVPFRRLPVASGALAVFSGGRRADRAFGAWLLAGELGLPLVASTVPVAGCVALVEWDPPTGSGAGPRWPGEVVMPRFSATLEDGTLTVTSPVGEVSTGYGETTVTTPLGGVAVTDDSVSVTTPILDLHVGPDGVSGSVHTPEPPDLPAPAGPPTPGDILGLVPGVDEVRASIESLVGDLAIPRGSVVVLSLRKPSALLDAVAHVAVHFSRKGRGVADAPPGPRPHAAPDRIDPACCVDVVIDGVSYGFSEVTAVACAAHGSRGTVYPHVVLRRAITLDRALYRWRMNLVAGQADVRSVGITHLSSTGEPLRSWWIEGAWPVRWTGPSFDALGTGLAMEELEIAIDRVDWT